MRRISRPAWSGWPGRGWSWRRRDGLLTGRFEATDRTDLRYLVIPCGGRRHFPRQEDYSRFGWELAGGFNGMAIFKSIPCGKTDEQGLREQLRQDGCIRPDRWTVPVLMVLLLAFTVLLWFGMSHDSAGPWFLSHRALGGRLMLWVSLLVTAANLVTLRSYPSAWVHGLTLPGADRLLAGNVFADHVG